MGITLLNVNSKNESWDFASYKTFTFFRHTYVSEHKCEQLNDNSSMSYQLIHVVTANICQNHHHYLWFCVKLSAGYGLFWVLCVLANAQSLLAPLYWVCNQEEGGNFEQCWSQIFEKCFKHKRNFSNIREMCKICEFFLQIYEKCFKY